MSDLGAEMGVPGSGLPEVSSHRCTREPPGSGKQKRRLILGQLQTEIQTPDQYTGQSHRTGTPVQWIKRYKI